MENCLRDKGSFSFNAQDRGVPYVEWLCKAKSLDLHSSPATGPTYGYSFYGPTVEVVIVSLDPRTATHIKETYGIIPDNLVNFTVRFPYHCTSSVREAERIIAALNPLALPEFHRYTKELIVEAVSRKFRTMEFEPETSIDELQCVLKRALEGLDFGQELYVSISETKRGFAELPIGNRLAALISRFRKRPLRVRTTSYAELFEKGYIRDLSEPNTYILNIPYTEHSFTATIVLTQYDSHVLRVTVPMGKTY